MNYCYVVKFAAELDGFEFNDEFDSVWLSFEGADERRRNLLESTMDFKILHAWVEKEKLHD